jgi:hypothetical protein
MFSNDVSEFIDSGKRGRTGRRRITCSAFNGRQIQPTEPLRIGQDIHLNDPAAGSREADHGKQAPVRKAAHEADVAIGFPAYFQVELAWAKLLGVVLLLAPVPAQLKEWAYAGFAVTLGSALIAHL